MEQFKSNFESSDSNEDIKSKLSKSLQGGLAAFMLVAAAGCEKPSKNIEESAGSERKQEVRIEQISPNSVLLSEYFKNINEGNFPATGQSERSLARAIDIALKKGMRVAKNSRIEISARATVPVKITVDGQIVPVGPDDYTARELQMVKVAQSISTAMGAEELPSDAGKFEDFTKPQSEEKISPIAEKVFRNSDANRPEKRKSKGDF